MHDKKPSSSITGSLAVLQLTTAGIHLDTVCNGGSRTEESIVGCGARLDVSQSRLTEDVDFLVGES